MSAATTSVLSGSPGRVPPGSAPRSRCSWLLADHRHVLGRRTARLGAHTAPVGVSTRTNGVALARRAEADGLVDGELEAAALTDVPDVAVTGYGSGAMAVQCPADLRGGRRVAAGDAVQIEGAAHGDAAEVTGNQLVVQEVIPVIALCRRILELGEGFREYRALDRADTGLTDAGTGAPGTVRKRGVGFRLLGSGGLMTACAAMPVDCGVSAVQVTRDRVTSANRPPPNIPNDL